MERWMVLFVLCAFVCLWGGVDSRSHKRGISLNIEMLLCHDFNVFRGKVTWWYDWLDTPDYWDAMRSSCGPLLENRAAMVWGWRSKDRHIRIPHDAKVVLGYNEPNHREQSNLTAKEAALHWPAIEKAAGAHRILVSPSPTRCSSYCVADMWPWMDEFLHRCHGCRMDYIATHLYTCDAHGDMAFLEQVYKRYHKKIWVTEFACLEKQSLEDQMAYMTAILPMLEAAPYVYRYAWFISRWEGDYWVSRNASLLEHDSSTLTPLGRYYFSL